MTGAGFYLPLGFLRNVVILQLLVAEISSEIRIGFAMENDYVTVRELTGIVG